ncbi:hypothetical protein ES703_124303 [subsurface metagenome]
MAATPADIAVKNSLTSSSEKSTGSIYCEGLVIVYIRLISFPLRYWSMELAAILPEATASTTVLGPVTRSPPAKIPGRFVWQVSESVTRVSHFENSRASFSRKEISGFSLIETISVSSSTVNSEPSIGTGLLRPDSSKSPIFILMNSQAFNFPFLVIILFGAVKYSNFIPSINEPSTSSLYAGISSIVLL